MEHEIEKRIKILEREVQQAEIGINQARTFYERKVGALLEARSLLTTMKKMNSDEKPEEPKNEPEEAK